MIGANDLTWDDLVRVGPGTRGGEYLRCFWWPVALSEEVKDIPVPVKILGEELVLFRDLSGELALLGGHCSHRRASLEYGRIEREGIRCAYHGWYFDRRGQVLDRPAEPIRETASIRHPWYPARDLGGFVFGYLGTDREHPPPLPRYDILVGSGYRVAERGDAELGKAYNCNWLQGVENTTDPSHVPILHGGFQKPPVFKAIEGEYGLDIHILGRGAGPNTVKARKKCTVLPTLNRKSRTKPGAAEGPINSEAVIQQAIWVIPNDDTHCEEMRLTVYPQRPKEDRYYGRELAQARARNKKLYDRRIYGEIRGITPLEDKAVVESQGPIADRSLEHPGYGDRAVLALRKMIREGVVDVANGRKPKGVLEKDLDFIDLDIGDKDYELHELPEILADLAPAVENLLQEGTPS